MGVQVPLLAPLHSGPACRAEREKNDLKAVARWLFGLSLIGLLVWLHRRELIEVASGGFRWGFVYAAFAACLLATTVSIMRWHMLVKVQGFDHPLTTSLRIGFVGVFFNFVVPGSVGGDVVRAALLGRQERGLGRAAASVLIDRVLGLTSLAILTATCAAAFWPQTAAIGRGVPVASATVFVATAALGLTAVLLPSLRAAAHRILKRVPFAGAKLSSLLDAASGFRRAPGKLLFALLFGLVSHIGFVIALRCAALALGPPSPSLAEHFALAPAGLMFAAVPLTPAGLGLVDAAMVELFQLAGTVAARGLLMMMLYRVVQIAVAMIGMGLFLTGPRTSLSVSPDR